MTIILTALPIEARPFIAELGLKGAPVGGRFAVYQSADGEVMLVVSGTGKINAAVAITAMLTGLEKKRRDTVRVCNFGFAGSLNAETPVGAVRLINKIVDVGSGRAFFPEMLVRTGLAESGLATFDFPVCRPADPSHNDSDSPSTGRLPGCRPVATIPEPLVDMEAAGVFQAASAFVPLAHIACAKVVSDHLEGILLDREGAANLMATALPDFLRVKTAMENASARVTAMPPELASLTASLAEAMRLTATQQAQLHDAVRSCSLRLASPEKLIAQITAAHPENATVKSNKTQRNARLRELLARLANTTDDLAGATDR